VIAPSQTLVSLIGAYGLAAVPLLMAAESCGLPFPREVIMLVAGAPAGVRSRNSGRSTGGPGATRASDLQGCPIVVLLALLYSVPSAPRCPCRSPASLRLELLVLWHQLRVLERQVKRPRWAVC
jgi:hypothetical protein